MRKALVVFLMIGTMTGFEESQYGAPKNPANCEIFRRLLGGQRQVCRHMKFEQYIPTPPLIQTITKEVEISTHYRC